jgi:hypothetical protein
MWSWVGKNAWLFIFGLIFCLYALSPRYITMNPDSRFSLTRAIVHNGTFAADGFLDPATNLDWSSYEGHYFTNKAPGVSFLAVPFYFVALKIEQTAEIDLSTWSYRNLRWVDVIVTGFSSVLLSYLLLQFLLTATANEKSAGLSVWLAVAAYALGTIVYPFSTMFWGHQTAAFLVFVAFLFLYRNRYLALSGFFFGFAVLTEYSTAILAPGFVYLLFQGRGFNKDSFKRALYFCLGGLPVFALFLYYHWVCFGGPMTLAPRYQNPALGVEMSTRLFGVLALPSLEILYQLMFGTSRGLFYISPYFVSFLCGLLHFVAPKTATALVLFCLWCIGSMFLFNASYNGWHGGASSGPRYLIPMLPFLAVGLAWVRVNVAYLLLFGLSLLNIALIVAVDSTAQPELNLLAYVYSGVFERFRFWDYALPILLVEAVICVFIFAKKRSLDGISSHKI